MTHFICQTCGTQYADRATEPADPTGQVRGEPRSTVGWARAHQPTCRICLDDRQYVDWAGQRWTTHEDLLRNHEARLEMDGDLLGIGITPSFAIPQRALYLPTDAVNILWECTSLASPKAVAELKARGGVDMIVISHPHFYSSMIEWSDAFGGVPVLIHEADKAWVNRSSANLTFWQGDTHALSPTVSLYRCPGHFPGSTVLHWKAGPKGKSILLPGDALHVVQDRRHVTFMYSVANYIPSHPDNVSEIRRRLQGLEIDDVYGYTWGLNIVGGGRAAVDESFERYSRAVGR